MYDKNLKYQTTHQLHRRTTVITSWV